MAEEIKEPENNQDEDYIEAIKKLKENSVPKDEFEELKEKNRQLLDTIVNGTGDEEKTPEPPKVDTDALRKELYTENCDLSNLEYIQKTLELRDAIIAEGGNDPFLPYGKDVVVEDDDVAAAERVAQALKETVEYADGDSAIFTNELQRIMIDSAPVRRKR